MSALVQTPSAHLRKYFRGKFDSVMLKLRSKSSCSHKDSTTNQQRTSWPHPQGRMKNTNLEYETPEQTA